MALRIPGKSERRLALAILVTALVPLVAALYTVRTLFDQASAIWFDPAVGRQLDRGVDLYTDYVRLIKDDMRHQTDAIAARSDVRAAVQAKDAAAAAALDAIFPKYPQLVSLEVKADDGTVLAVKDRGRPVDEQKERSLRVPQPLGSEDSGAMLVATFATDRARLDVESAGEVVTKYHALESSRGDLERGYLLAFTALLVITMPVTLVLGTLIARGVTRRINRLAAAINLVAEGDLTVRVPVTGSDELTDLARTFNRMLGDMEQSRARIEFLQRIGAWQEMAQRLAHEIKNPLTPIQLAVQECHRKYPGDDPRFRALLDTTLEIVEEEVGTLRRLVGNFSNFARLPHAELREASLRDFLKECQGQLGHLEDPATGDLDAEPISAPNVSIEWKIPDEPLAAAIDRQMLRRVLINLVRNAVQAIRDTKKPRGRVVVTARREGDGAAIEIEDDGPGIPDESRARVFDPYFTTKVDGTGLGLAIVKKIVVEHGGSVDVRPSAALGGACFALHLPGPQTVSLAAARDRASRAQLDDASSP